MLNEVPHRGTPMPPTDPLIYRFYELVMVNGPAWKAGDAASNSAPSPANAPIEQRSASRLA
jgi:hypothetical protein